MHLATKSNRLINSAAPLLYPFYVFTDSPSHTIQTFAWVWEKPWKICHDNLGYPELKAVELPSWQWNSVAALSKRVKIWIVVITGHHQFSEPHDTVITAFSKAPTVGHASYFTYLINSYLNKKNRTERQSLPFKFRLWRVCKERRLVSIKTMRSMNCFGKACLADILLETYRRAKLYSDFPESLK
jgi:hypothetical protein